jgi:hypothetical protein
VSIGDRPGESSEGSDDECDAEGSDGWESATGTAKRHWLTNDALAGALGASLIAAVLLDGVGWLNLQTIPTEILYLYVFVVGSSMAWAFGKDAIEAWRGRDS